MMAALKGFVDELENELTCSICHDIFTDPKTLQCLHNYCLQCIADWYESCRNRKQEFTCPTCKTGEIDLPDGNASKLRSSFYLGALLQLLHAMRSKSDQQQQELPECVSCEKSLVLVAFCPQCNGIICAECVNAHKTMKHLRDEHHTTMLNEFKQENVDNFIKNQMLCKKKFHEKNKLEYYCKEETCRQCICQKCATLYHRNHDMSSLEEAVEEVKTAMKQDMNRVNQLKKKYEEDLEQSKQDMARIQKEIDVAKQQVHNIADAMVKIIRDNEVTMIKTLDKTLLEQQHENHDEQSDISDGITHLSEFKLHCQTVLDRSVACEILESQDVIKQRCQTLLEMLTVLLSKSIQRNVTFCYSTNQKVIESLQDVGKIVKSVTDPSSCSIESLNVVRCGFVNEFNIITRNAAGELCYTREESIDIRIKDAEGNEVEKKVIDKQSGKYRVSFRAEKAAPYEILVNIGGEPIKNSPQNINTLDVKTEFKPVKTFGEKGDGKGQLDWPTTISLSNNGEIAIAECNNHRIQIFSLDGKHFREFREGESKLFKPFGAVFNEDKIIVIDRPDNHGRIQVFDLNGTYVKTIYHRPDE